MDQKGSLIDTQLRIYPYGKFKKFLDSLPSKHVTPNIANVVAGTKVKKSDSNVTIDIHLNDEDILNIHKIKQYMEANESQDSESSKKYEGSSDNHDKKQQINEVKVKKNINKQIKEKHLTTNADDDKENQLNNELNTKSSKDINKKDLDVNDAEESEQDTIRSKIENDCFYLNTEDLDWLYHYLQKQRENGEKDVPFLYMLLENAQIDFPENVIIKRNPVLEARCVKLRAQQDARDYRKMTKTVDNVRISYPEDSISYQIKQLNRQLIAIGQFILSIFAGFMFGFRGVQWMAGTLDFGFRLMMGVMCALIIALAEIYFLAKKLNEELNASKAETIQIGGPPKLASDHSYYSQAKSTGARKEKTHVD